PLHHQLVLHRSTDGAPDVLDLDRRPLFPRLLCHRYNPSACLPSILATSAGFLSCFKPSKVAFTTLCGFVLPRDFVSMLEIPADCTTARTGPPAITPVPSDAGFNITLPAP